MIDKKSDKTNLPDAATGDVAVGKRPIDDTQFIILYYII